MILSGKVRRAPDAPSALVQDMGIDHGGVDVAVAQQFLDRPDIVPFFQEMGSERMPEGMAGDPLRNSRGRRRILHRSLKNGLVEMVPEEEAGFRIPVFSARREYPLPAPLPVGIGKFNVQPSGKCNASASLLQILFVANPDLLEVQLQAVFDGARQYGHAILVPFSLPHGDLPVPEVDILDAEPQGFEEAKPRAVHEHGRDPVLSVQVAENGLDFLSRQHDREALRFLRPYDVVEPGKSGPQDVPVQEKKRTQRLVLG